MIDCFVFLLASAYAKINSFLGFRKLLRVKSGGNGKPQASAHGFHFVYGFTASHPLLHRFIGCFTIAVFLKSFPFTIVLPLLLPLGPLAERFFLSFLLDVLPHPVLQERCVVFLELLEKRINFVRFYVDCPRQVVQAKLFGFVDRQPPCPVSSKVSFECVHFPIHTSLRACSSTSGTS